MITQEKLKQAEQARQHRPDRPHPDYQAGIVLHRPQSLDALAIVAENLRQAGINETFERLNPGSEAVWDGLIADAVGCVLERIQVMMLIDLAN